MANLFTGKVDDPWCARRKTEFKTEAADTNAVAARLPVVEAGGQLGDGEEAPLSESIGDGLRGVRMECGENL